MKDFVNLHAHCNLGSMRDGLHSAEQLLEKVKEVGQKAVALTDHGTMAAHLDAYKASKKTGVQLIPGCEMYYVPSYDVVEVDGKMKKPKRQHVVLLAQNQVGYRNLLNINFIGFQNQHQSMGHVFSVIDWNNLSSRTEGIIATSACANGPLSKMLMGDNYNEAKEIAIRFNSIFPNRFFLEIHPHHLKAEGVDQHKINLELIKLSREIGLPLVTAVDAHYLTRGDEKYHDMLMALNSKKTVNDPERFRYGVDDFYVKTGDEVFAFLSEHYGQEIATECLANTVRISEMCEIPTYLEVAGNHLPKFPVQDEPDYIEFLEWKTERKINLPEDTAYMRFKCVKGFKEKFAHMSEEDRKLRWERVKTELKVLEGNNFSSYMLVVADFIHWSKTNNILVGPGRGSVGGCMIAYLLGIHQVDPIAYGLLFERFQNAEKKDLPDIDIDFTSAGRDAVQEYVRQKYGADRCAQVSNINTYTPKNAIPDLVKSMREILPKTLLNNPNEYFQLSNKIKDAIDDEASSIDEALEMSEDLRNIARAAPELMDYAKRIVGLPKEYSTHAAAMVISDVPILDFAPLRIDKNGATAVQYEKNRCEAVGLIKMDFLAISTLDIIDETFKNIRRIGIENAPKRMEDIPLEDAATYETIQKGQTRCVFQLGKSGTMAGLCKQVKPKSILDIAAINALGRPSCGPIEQEDGTTYSERQEYIMRREGRRSVSYLHPSLQIPLKETFGLCIMEEQLMSVAREVAGWDLNKADGLRKLTKMKGKNPELAQQLEADFIKDSMNKHNMCYELGKEIWDKVVEKFSGYGFNKCLILFNFLLSPSGWKSLSELKKGDEIYSFDSNKKIKTNIKEIGKTDRQMKVWEVKFLNGGTFRGTDNHRFLTNNGYKTINEILKYRLPVRNIYNNNCHENYLEYSNENNIRNDFQSGFSRHFLAKKYGLSYYKVNRIINGRKGVNLTNYENLNTLDSINNEQEAYWVGFLYGDGDLENYGIRCSLAHYDYEHLSKLSEFFGVKNYTLRESSDKKTISLDISSVKLKENLLKIGLVFNKDKEKYSIPKINDTLFKSFIIGLLDSDGCVGISKYRSGRRIHVDFIAQQHLLEEIKFYFKNKIPNFNNKVNVTQDGKSFKLSYFSEDATKILNYLYEDATIFLPRKRIRFERFVNGQEDWHPKNEMWRDLTPEGYTTIKSIRDLGFQDTYYIEVDDENHNYILDGGVVSANSHATFYSLIGYYTAYLKVHYPAPFLAAYLKIRTERGGISKDAEIEMAKTECRRLGIRIMPPDVNRSGTGYDVLDDKSVVMGLSAIKGLGDSAVNEIVNNQPFESFIDFIYKTDGRFVNKSKMEALAKAACFDSLNVPRKFVHDEGKGIRDKFNIFMRKKQKDGYNDSSIIEEFPISYSNFKDWTQPEKLRFEQEVTGQLVSGTIHDLYPGFFLEYGVTPLSRIRRMPARADVIVEVIIKSHIRNFQIKKDGRLKNKWMAKYQVEDVHGTQMEMTIWPDLFKEATEQFQNDVPLRALCRVSEFEGSKSLMLAKIEKCLKIS